MDVTDVKEANWPWLGTCGFDKSDRNACHCGEQMVWSDREVLCSSEPKLSKAGRLTLMELVIHAGGSRPWHLTRTRPELVLSSHAVFEHQSQT